MQVSSPILRLLLAAIASGFVVSAHAAMYKWTDAEGNTQYSESPPPEGNVTEIAPPPRIAAPASSDNGSGEQPAAGLAGAEGDAQEEEAPLTPEQLETYKRNCEAAKANMELYKTSRRIKQADDGKVVTMDEGLRAKKMQQAEEQIKKYCR